MQSPVLGMGLVLVHVHGRSRIDSDNLKTKVSIHCGPTARHLTEVYRLDFLYGLSRSGSRDLRGTSNGAKKDIIV